MDTQHKDSLSSRRLRKWDYKATAYIWALAALLALSIPATCASLTASILPATATVKAGLVQTFTVTLSHPRTVPEVAVIAATVEYSDADGLAYTSSATAELTIVHPYKLSRFTLPFYTRVVAGSVKLNGTAVTPSATGVITTALEINEGQSAILTFGVK
jgi:hypothetical protein